MSVEWIFREPYDPTEAGYPGINERTVVQEGMIIDYDVRVEMRDGVGIRVDVFRPDNDEPVPVIIGWAAYGKHLAPANWFPGSGVREEWISPYTIFEAPDPLYWTRHGYAVIYVDPRGQWGSEGQNRGFLNTREAADVYDLIEWAGTAAWSTGKVGMSGVSYFAIIQWFAAATRPPHLAAINPWEGFSDRYRETVYHGGMLEDGLNDMWWHGHGPGIGSAQTEDGWSMAAAHPLFDEYWADNAVDLAKIDVPAYIVASWTDQGLHTRGTLEGYKRISSTDKWLVVHGRKKWEYQYQPENVERLRAFFDQFLKGVEAGVRDWPRVQLEIRERCYVGEIRDEDEWPLARTEYTRLYLDAASQALALAPPAEPTQIVYLARGPFGAQFEYAFPEDTELTGHSKLRLWVAPVDSTDMDLFVALEKVDREGERVGFPFFSTNLDGPSALGWLRVSHRALDETLSTEYQPVHSHTAEHKLARGELVPVDIEIWPSSVLFRKGERLRLLVKGKDFDHYESPPGAPQMTHTATVNVGNHLIKTGGDHQSYLLVPVIPEKR
ncbi:MAG TPA: CocE/NonD family hydrolase [Microbacterium sp.]|uniref:CocE/NonD family hydrolase n=1 Tax=Microbacterium sp. TaxID=51671 RepID=UPI002BF5B429|nr:CocE/NonD family hydrolase [Microbacterium sp.]HWI30809.1 CocE/NonD family hydrolase [Microbacterium sp.]